MLAKKFCIGILLITKLSIIQNIPTIIKQNPANLHNLSFLIFCDQARKKQSHIITSINIKTKAPFKINIFKNKEKTIDKLKMINNNIYPPYIFYFKIKVAEFKKNVKIKKPLV